MRSDWGSHAGFAALAALHFALCLYFFPPGEIFSGEPLLTGDYAFRFLDSEHTAPRIRSGAFVGYSTRAAAGYPTGLAGLLNHKPFMLLLAATPDAWHPLAFNLGVLFALWLPPALVYASARRFGLDRLAAGVALGLFLFAWYGSSLFRFFWAGGSVLFLDAAAVALWALALVQTREPRRFPIGATVAAAAVPWIHPLGVGVLGTGFAAWLLTARTDLRRKLRELVLLGGFVLLANLPWLVVGWQQSTLRGALAYPVYLGGLQSLLFDLIEGPLHLIRANEEAAVLAPLLIAALVARPGGVARRPLFWTAAGLAVLSYFGTALGLGLYQPYRFAIPLAAVLAIAGAPLVAEFFRGGAGWSRTLLVLILLLVLADRVRVAARIDASLGAGLASSDAWALEALRAHAPAEGWQRGGRVLAECQLATDTDADRPRLHRVQYSFAALERYLPAEFLGSPLLQSATPEEPLSFWLGNLLWRPVATYDAQAFGEVLDLYDVGFVLTVRPETRDHLRSFAPRLRVAAERGNMALFVVERRTTRVRSGPGRAWSDGDAIFFDTDRAEPAVLRYHWVDGLAAEPPAKLAPAEERAGSVTSFIEVRPPAPGLYRIALSPYGATLERVPEPFTDQRPIRP